MQTQQPLLSFDTWTHSDVHVLVRDTVSLELAKVAIQQQEQQQHQDNQSANIQVSLLPDWSFTWVRTWLQQCPLCRRI